MIVHGLSPQGQVGGQMIQNVVASWPGVGQARPGHDQCSKFLCVEAESSGGISPRWIAWS